MSFRISGGIATTAFHVAAGIIIMSAPRGRAQAPDLAEKSHRAKELMESGKPAEAVPIYRELVRAVPGNPGLLMDLGLALDMSGDKPAAIRKYQEALKVDSSLFPALLLMGTAYLDIGQPAKAIDPLERSLKIQPESTK